MVEVQELLLLQQKDVLIPELAYNVFRLRSDGLISWKANRILKWLANKSEEFDNLKKYFAVDYEASSLLLVKGNGGSKRPLTV